ncbi:MAG: 16S rRNA (guanine(527)-N(7))-methyltransferase RsmG [Thermodesulfobacteriota bacterium]
MLPGKQKFAASAQKPSKPGGSRQPLQPTPQDLLCELHKTELACLASDQQRLESLNLYLSTLLEWNRRFNLVGLKDWKGILHELILDSLYLARLLPKLELDESCLSLDVGAGAGLPGIPLRIYWSQGTYLLLEPRQKRAAFLQHILSRLQLERTLVRSCRLQELPPEHCKANLILSRGLAAWPEFLRLSLSFLQPRGLALVFSSRPWLSKDNPPSGWKFYTELEYTQASTGSKRYFWLFSLNRACS